MFQRSSLRYAHTNGYSFVTYSADGKQMITCGSDGDIRSWNGIEDDDPVSNCLGEFVMCIKKTNNKLFAATDCNTVHAYSYPEMDSLGVIFNFSAPVTCICLQGNYLAAGSEDMRIKVKKYIETNDINELIKEVEMDLEGHKGPILSLQINSKTGILASIAGDGQVKIWQLSDGTEIKTISGLPRSNSFESTIFFGTPVFEPTSGNFLAYVNRNKVHILDTTNWELNFLLSDETKNDYEYTCCDFSEDGSYLAAGTRNGEFTVFDFLRKVPLTCETANVECKAVTSIAWQPKNSKEFAYCDASGQLGTIFHTNNTDENEEEAEKEKQTDDVDFGDINFTDDTNDQNDIDIDGISLDRIKKNCMGNFDENSRNSVASSNSDATEKHESPAYVKTFNAQSPFQPSSTPTCLEHRYLVWNHIGLIIAHEDGGDGAIDVEFHDTSMHHAIHLSNHHKYSMGSLSNTVVALTADNSTKITCIYLSTGSNKECTINLPDCENVIALTTSDKLLVVVTSMQFLRIFTALGTQREVISLPGPIIAVSSYNTRILAVYHAAPTGILQQNLSCLFIQLQGMHLKSENIHLPLTPERQMTWLGFSDAGSPAFSDSMGLVQMYSLKSKVWLPVCDTMKLSISVSNNYFIISISEREQNIQAVLCRGSSYPMTNPRPIIQELAMRLPLCDEESDKTQLEDVLLRSAHFDGHMLEKQFKETAIKLFALSCRTEFDERALELMETIASTDLLQLSEKYANKLGKFVLAERLAVLKEKIKEVNYDNLEENEEPIKPLHINDNQVKNNAKLEPKVMHLSSSRRSSLKSFSKKPIITQSPLSEPNEIYNSEKSTTSFILDTPINENTESISTHSPLIRVNPFAVKRKISDLDDKGTNLPVLNAGKLKFSKN